MSNMSPEELARILSALAQADVREFSLKTGDYELAIKRGLEVPLHTPVAVSPTALAPTVAETPTAAQTEVKSEPKSVGAPIKAPIVGTFYASPSPDASPYVQVGDKVEAGQVLCIIEAMKLMNEIESESSGIVREILVKNAEPVEYGQTLFMIE